MSTAVLECEATQSAPPVRLPPWQKNPYGLGNLYDMLKVAAYGFISIGSNIQKLANVLEQIGDEREAEPEELAQYAELLNFIEISSWNLGIIHTGGIARSIREEQAGKRLRNGQIRQALREINRSFVQELEKEVFLHVNGPNASLFGKADAFGAKVAKQFASCNADVWAAGNCIAMDLNDSCVFHLMRALERGLAALAKKFSVAHDQRNWHNIIEELESAIRKMDATWGSDWKDLQSKYSEAACQFMFFKAAWRNHVSHGRDTYDALRAQTIFDATKRFMVHLAEIGISE